ncbi:MAG: PfkB family carbohydrate kinase [Gemmataceae bacterium]
MSDPFAPPLAEAVVVGTGRLTLDVIVEESATRREPAAQGGGTCGNVLTNLACLGWQAYPVADLGEDDSAEVYCRDLQRWGVRLDLVRRYPGQQTPVIIHHVGPRGHAYSSRCPFCEGRLQYFEPVPLERVQARLPALPDARVYFFDRDSPGSLLLARECRQRGALIMYEPNYAGPESQVEQAVGLAHVLKFSRERLGGLAEERALDGPWLIIETLGEEGLRYQVRRQGAREWVQLPAIRVPVVRDAGGSGDWCSAGLLHGVGQQGAAGLADASEEQLHKSLRFGQALAAWNCAFVGARGGVYHASAERWHADVRALLRGETFDPGVTAGPGTQGAAGAFCPHCGGKRSDPAE